MKPEPWKQFSDVELVVASLIGNLQAFDELAIRFRPAMLTVAEQIVGNNGAAEDVVQDALLLAFKALPQLDDLNRFSSWLYSITRHRALRHSKDEHRFELKSDLDEVILEHTYAVALDPAKIFEDHDEHNEVRVSIKQLPSEYQVVLRLYYWDNMPQQRIADFLSLPLSTVKWRLYKAKQMLRERLEQYYQEGDNHVYGTGKKQRNQTNLSLGGEYRETREGSDSHGNVEGRREKVHQTV